jgi:hypothetical protein
MKRWVIVVVVLGGLLLAAEAAAQEATLFVSTQQGERIFRVNAATGQTQQIYNNPGSRFEDLVVGPDNLLYACDPHNGRIVRMTQTGSMVQVVYQAAGSDPQGPQCGRFTHTGDLLFNTGNSHTGVWMIPAAQLAGLPTPVVPVQLTGLAGGGEQGLAVTVGGNVLAVDRPGGRIFRSLMSDFDPGVTPAPTTAVFKDLMSPAGLARNSKNRVFVATETGIKKCDLDDFEDAGPVSCNGYATFTGRRPWHIEFHSDDTLYAVTAVTLDPANWPTGSVSNANGHIWKITGPGGACPGTNCRLVTALNVKVSGRFLPAVGLGIGPTCVAKTQTYTPANLSQEFHFGSHSFLATAAGVFGASVDLTVEACQVAPSQINTQFDSNFPPAGTLSALPFTGEGGWVTQYETMQNPALALQTPVDLELAYFLSNAENVNPRLVHNFINILDGARYYPTGPVAAEPGDPVSGGRANDFGSIFVLADLSVVEDTSFCGFQSPLNADPDNPAEFNAGKKIPFKFKVAAEGGTCQNGPYITEAVSTLSIAQLNPFATIPFITVGNSDPDDPGKFRFEAKGQQFTLTVDSTGMAPGLYMATVISDAFLPQSVFFVIK